LFLVNGVSVLLQLLKSPARLIFETPPAASGETLKVTVHLVLSLEKAFFNQYKNVYVFSKMQRSIVIATQRIADAFLLISGPEGLTSGKLYEYLFANKPILNIGGKKGISEIINGENFGITIEPTNVEGIKKYLTKLNNGELKFNYPYMEKYTRRYQCKKLAEELKKVLQNSEN